MATNPKYLHDEELPDHRSTAPTGPRPYPTLDFGPGLNVGDDGPSDEPQSLTEEQLEHLSDGGGGPWDSDEEFEEWLAAIYRARRSETV